MDWLCAIQGEDGASHLDKVTFLVQALIKCAKIAHHVKDAARFGTVSRASIHDSCSFACPHTHCMIVWNMRSSKASTMWTWQQSRCLRRRLASCHGHHKGSNVIEELLGRHMCMAPSTIYTLTTTVQNSSRHWASRQCCMPPFMEPCISPAPCINDQ